MRTPIQVEGGDRIEVHAEPTAVPGLVAIFRDSEVGAPDLRWSLTHKRSGMSVAPLRFRTFEQAVDAAAVFGAIDMTRPALEIASDPRVLECVRFLWAYFPETRLSAAIAARPMHYIDIDGGTT